MRQSRSTTWRPLACGVAMLGGMLTLATAASAQIDAFEAPPINYGDEAELHDPIAKLQRQLESGAVTLQRESRRGYLPDLLKKLGIPVSSQMLILSKTSFQLRRISPRTPRAVYFNDDVYIGYVQGGDVLEISSVDPQQGAIFYTLAQHAGQSPNFKRRTYSCLQCHASSLTQQVPGHVVRSVFPAPDGQPLLASGTFRTTDASPLYERWGGWYVTGEHGKQRHMGNVTLRGNDPSRLNTLAGANVQRLDGLFDPSPYLSPHSDIVALLVHDHQTNFHNTITAANYEARMVLHDEIVLARTPEAADHASPGGARDRAREAPAWADLSATSQRRLGRAADKLLRGLLFSGAAAFTDPIQGTSSFAEDFAATGLRDGQGRSLRDLNLRTRLFEYPCSYLIHSDAFNALPPIILNHIYDRLHAILTGADDDEAFAHLTQADRKAILEILRATKPQLRKRWQ